MKLVGSIFLFLLSIQLSAQKTAKNVFGIVTDGKELITEAVIKNLSSDDIYLTDAEGKYQITAYVGDVLEFSFASMKTKRITVEDITRVLNVRLRPNINILEEVTVTKRLSPQERLRNDYAKNTGIIKTFYGFKDINGTSGRIADLEKNTVSYTCLVDLLRARFPFLRILGSCASFDTAVFARGVNSILNPRPLTFEVDGQLLSQIPEVPVSDIKRIAVLSDPASTFLYGIGGVIVINTYGFSPRPPSISEKLGLSNVFKERSNLKKINSLDSKPYYQEVLDKSIASGDSKEKFYALRDRYSSSPYFLLDAYEFFYEQGEVDFADTIVETTFTNLFDKNAVILKALAYIYEEQGRFTKANEVFKQVFILRPNYQQSYYDLANSYRDLGDYDFAAELYSRYYFLVEEGFFQIDTLGFDKLINKDFSNLIKLSGEKLSLSKKVKKATAKDFQKPSTRIVFEWNDGQAEFDLEFLKDESEYYVWQHNYDESPEDIESEKKFGYSMTEYIIDADKSPSSWKVNLKYSGNMSLTPTYLKTTTYFNYGSSSQRKEVKVFKLNIKDINQSLFNIYNQTTSVAVN